jgi:uncharacterized protein YkwD
MTNRFIQSLSAAALAALLCVVSPVAAFASNNPYAAVEAKNRQAIAAAEASGLIPSGLTIYDCVYQTGEDGVMRVVEYKDASGAWIDAATCRQQEYLPGTFSEKLSDATLAAYADEVFKLVNEARADAGLSLLERDGELDAAAMIRAEECASVQSLRVGGLAHVRPDGTPFYTVMGVEENFSYGENLGLSGGGPEDRMRGWLDSDGHRANILDTTWGYTKIGVGVVQDADGSRYWCQLFYRPI